MYREFLLELLDGGRAALSIKEQVNVINCYPPQFPESRALFIKFAGFPPWPDFGVDDLFHFEADDRGEKFFVACFFEGSSYRGQQLSFLRGGQGEIVG